MSTDQLHDLAYMVASKISLIFTKSTVLQTTNQLQDIEFDCVIVVDRNIQSAPHYRKVVKYFQELQMNGVVLKLDYGVV